MGSGRGCQLGKEGPNVGTGGGRGEEGEDGLCGNTKRPREARAEPDPPAGVSRLPCYAPRRRRAAASWGLERTGTGCSASWTPGPGPAQGPPLDGIARLHPSGVTPPAPAPRPGRGQAPDPLPGSPGVRRAMTQHVESRRAGPT